MQKVQCMYSVLSVASVAGPGRMKRRDGEVSGDVWTGAAIHFLNKNSVED